LRKSKPITEDDLSNPIKTYQTTFDFLRGDIERYREQKIKHQCFQVLHPWAYDLNTVDMKYIVNTNLEGQICKILADSVDAQIFWLAFFKPQLSCPADEFIEAIRQLAEMNAMGYYFHAKYEELGSLMAVCDFVVSIEENAEMVIKVVQDFVDEAMKVQGYCPLRDQFKVCSMSDSATQFLDFEALTDYTVTLNPDEQFYQFSSDQTELGKAKLNDVIGHPGCDLQRRLTHVKALDIPQKRLILKFEQVDTEELKDVEIVCDGDRAIFKVGEGETSHYHVPNDKKLWETQFMICSMDGRYYIRDLGFVHASRLKLDTKCEVQIQKGCLVDLGKVVHYHFDKAIHLKEPTQPDSSSFYVLRHKKAYEVDPEDFPHLRARPTWVSAEEHIENIQNEINIYAEG